MADREVRYGKNHMYDRYILYLEMDNPQPSPLDRYDKCF